MKNPISFYIFELIQVPISASTNNFDFWNKVAKKDTSGRKQKT